MSLMSLVLKVYFGVRAWGKKVNVKDIFIKKDILLQTVNYFLIGCYSQVAPLAVSCILLCIITGKGFINHNVADFLCNVLIIIASFGISPLFVLGVIMGMKYFSVKFIYKV